MSTTDRIEKKVTLRAPVARVWKAIADAKAFGTWFGVAFDGDFQVGEVTKGHIVPTKMDAEIAKAQEPYTGLACNVRVERIEPQRLLAFRWHPNAVETSTDHDAEPTTLVTFALREVPEGTELTITESGFDAIPLERRAKAFADNEQGWAAQTMLLGRYLDDARA